MDFPQGFIGLPRQLDSGAWRKRLEAKPHSEVLKDQEIVEKAVAPSILCG
jgi:hypothetical protein